MQLGPGELLPVGQRCGRRFMGLGVKISSGVVAHRQSGGKLILISHVSWSLTGKSHWTVHYGPCPKR